MMNKEQEIKYLQGMIVELNKAINNAQQFGDEVTVNAINNQIVMFQKRLQQLEEQSRLEREVQIMINECTAVYGSRDTKKINDWLENNYQPFRKYWIAKVGEDVFGDTWNRINRASK